MYTSKVRSVAYLNEFAEIKNRFEIISKKGQGSFASVFGVQDRRLASNSTTEPQYALKMIIPTTQLRRIENEDYFPFVDEAEIKRYMRSLFCALYHIHRHQIIHRDIKPSNFLLDKHSRRFYLVDFGLAHSETYGDVDDRWDAQFDVENVIQQNDQIESDKRPKESDHKSLGEQSQKTNAGSSTSPYLPPGQKQSPRIPPPQTPPSSRLSSFTNTPTSQPSHPTGSCVCGLHRLTICHECRRLPRAPAARRGGTLGFRPPEVMMRCPVQSTAIDLWAAGVILLAFLTGRYPLTKVEDDLDVLHTYVFLLGLERMQSGAKALNRRLLVQPRPEPREPDTSGSAWLRQRCIAIRKNDSHLAHVVSSASSDSTRPILSTDHVFPREAYDLLSRLLEPNPAKRITAREALCHTYLVKRRRTTTHSTGRSSSLSSQFRSPHPPSTPSNHQSTRPAAHSSRSNERIAAVTNNAKPQSSVRSLFS